MGKNENFHKNKVYIINYKIDGVNSLEGFLKKNIELIKSDSNSKINSEKIRLDKTKFGNSYFYSYDYIFAGSKYKVRNIFFEFNKKFYMYEYNSTQKLYHKYLNEAEFIFNNISFK